MTSFISSKFIFSFLIFWSASSFDFQVQGRILVPFTWMTCCDSLCVQSRIKEATSSLLFLLELIGVKMIERKKLYEF